MSGMITGRAGLDQLPEGVAVSDRHNVIWVKGGDLVWRSRERVPTSASTSLLLRLQVGPFRVSGQAAAPGDDA